MKDNQCKEASDILSDAILVIKAPSFLMNIGDWTWGDGGFGQIVQICHNFYEEYDNIPKGKNVGDYKNSFGIIKYFCTERKVRRNGTEYKQIWADTVPIMEDNIYANYWNIIQKHIKEDPQKYLAYQKYKPKELYGHIHVGYMAGPRFGKPEHTKEYYIELFSMIRKELPIHFTFVDLINIAQKYQCPFKLDKPEYHYMPTMYITLFYKIGEYQNGRQLFYSLGQYLDFGIYFDKPPIIPKDNDTI